MSGLGSPSPRAERSGVNNSTRQLPHVSKGLGTKGLRMPRLNGKVVVLTAMLLLLLIWLVSIERQSAMGDPKQRAAQATAVPVVAGGPGPVATVREQAVPIGENRPEGVPIKRTDWLVLKDYQAHGGSGPSGAIAIGIMGNKDAVGTPIFATHDGVVNVAKNRERLGNVVYVENGRWVTTYGYLDQIRVTPGQTVRRGEQIGTMGKTGSAPTPRLDYQVWEKSGSDKVNRNPMDYLGGT